MKKRKTVTLCILASIAAWGCAPAIGTGRGAGEPAAYPVPGAVER